MDHKTKDHSILSLLENQGVLRSRDRAALSRRSQVANPLLQHPLCSLSRRTEGDLALTRQDHITTLSLFKEAYAENRRTSLSMALLRGEVHRI
jgi:hypothetical protein